jgi:hypothetical protein
MLEFLRRKVSNRKVRLVAVACVQRYSAVDGAMRGLVRVSELYADGVTNWNELAAVRKIATAFARQAMQGNVGMGAGAVRHAAAVARPSAFAAAQGVLLAVVPEVAVQAIKEIIGNPFRPQTIDRSWLTWNERTIPLLAQAIYDERAFDRLPILADALEDANCTNPDILEHLRGPEAHARGCWAVDLLPGRE